MQKEETRAVEIFEKESIQSDGTLNDFLEVARELTGYSDTSIVFADIFEKSGVHYPAKYLVEVWKAGLRVKQDLITALAEAKEKAEKERDDSRRQRGAFQEAFDATSRKLTAAESRAERVEKALAEWKTWWIDNIPCNCEECEERLARTIMALNGDPARKMEDASEAKEGIGNEEK